MRRHLVGVQIGRHIHKHLIDAINMDVLWSHILQICLIDLFAHFDIVSHPWWSHDVVQLPVGMCFQFYVVRRLAREMPSRIASPLVVHLLHPLDHLEQPCPSTNAIGFHRRGHGQADGLVRPAFISHYQVRGQWIQSSGHALHRSVERLQVNGYVSVVGH